MSETSEIIDQIIRKDLAKRLKKDGYKKAGRNFYIDSGDHFKVVNIQASKTNHEGSGTFTMNLGVHFPAAAKLAETPPYSGQFPKATDCTVSKRVGRFMPDGLDHWWEVTSEVDLDVLSKSVGDGWTDYGKAWVEKVSKLEECAKDLADNRAGYLLFMAAVVNLLLENRETAKELVVLACKRQPLRRAKYTQWGQRQGLL